MMTLLLLACATADPRREVELTVYEMKGYDDEWIGWGGNTPASSDVLAPDAPVLVNYWIDLDCREHDLHAEVFGGGFWFLIVMDDGSPYHVWGNVAPPCTATAFAVE